MRIKDIIKKIKLGDIIIFLTIMVIAFLSMSFQSLASHGKSIAIISQNGNELYRIDLSEKKSHDDIEIKGEYTDVIEVNNGKIRFKDATCPDQICVQTGWISKPGQSAVCLPAKIIIKIIGDTKDDVDIQLR